MGSQDQHRSTDLFGAVAADFAAKQQARNAATAPEREARDKQLKADAALHGTAGWEALSPYRREMVSAWAAQQARGGADDA
ncbi:hypothetical protein [Streptomyces sp. NPDC000878]